MTSRVLWWLFEASNTLYSVIVIYMYFSAFLKKKSSVSFLPIIGGFSALFIVLSINNCFFDKTYSGLITVAGVCLLPLLFDGTLKEKVVAAFLLIIFFVFAEGFASLIVVLLLQVSSITILQPTSERMLGMLISNVFKLFILKAACIIRNKKYEILPFWYSALLLSTPLISIFIIYAIFFYNQSENPAIKACLSFLAMVSVMYVNLIIIYLFNGIVEKFTFQTRNNILEQQIKCQMKYYHDLSISHDEIKCLRHDTKNHLQCLSELVKSGCNEEALNYIASFNGALNEQCSIITTGNVVIDSMLNEKAMAMKENNIEFKYIIEIPENMKFDPFDACVIFGNSMDNAIEACQRIKKGPRRIRMILAYRSGNLLYNLVNTTDGLVRKERDGYLSSKREYSCCGYGLHNIQAQAEKYNGFVKVENHDNIFELSAILYNI